MLKTMNNKRIQICFFLCSLLLLECLNYGIFSLDSGNSSGINNPAAGWSGSSHSAMGDRVKAGLDAIGAVTDGVRLNLAPARNSRGTGFSPDYFFSVVISAILLAALINYLKLSRRMYIQFDSLQITTYLHKKDGQK